MAEQLRIIPYATTHALPAHGILTPLIQLHMGFTQSYALCVETCSMDTFARPTLLRWRLGTDRAQVYHYDEHVIEIVHATDGSKRSTFDGHLYTLHHVGFWIPRTVIERDGVEALRTTSAGFFQPQRIVLAGGTTYTPKWTNESLAKLVIRDTNNIDVLSLRLATEGGVHTETVLAADRPIDERTILLLKFAYDLFGGVMRGEGDADAFTALVV